LLVNNSNNARKSEMRGKRTKEKAIPKSLKINNFSPKPSKIWNLQEETQLPTLSPPSRASRRPQTSILLGTLETNQTVGKKSVVPSPKLAPKPKSRMGILNVNMTDTKNRREILESKDFDQFYKQSLLPKELKKLNPALYGMDSSNLMRAISPVYREPTEKEKDIIKMKFEVLKMNNKFTNHRKDLEKQFAPKRMKSPQPNVKTEFQKQFRKNTQLYETNLKMGNSAQIYRNGSCISPESKVRFSEIKGKLGFRGVTFRANSNIKPKGEARSRILSDPRAEREKYSDKVSEVSESSMESEESK